MNVDFSMATTGEDEYRMAASRGSLGDFYLRQECVFGPGYFSSYPCTKEEREQQLLIYCTRFLPSPIFKMEVTDRTAYYVVHVLSIDVKEHLIRQVTESFLSLAPHADQPRSSEEISAISFG
ncbi:uncharacterized protein LOC143769198 [Ranitomeya variabilis]|uniref:uncharacterized protein LOC143769198 n=1 Tax=Ranitomeya variabilis TaxID=490064 RepID=UPI0040563F52